MKDITSIYMEQSLACGIKAGERRTIMVSCKSHSDGWQGMWWPEMDRFVGKTVTIQRKTCIGNVRIDESLCLFPYFVFGKAEDLVAEKIEIGDVCVIDRAARTNKRGWQASWLPEMDEFVGKGVVITYIDEDGDFMIKGSNCCFPHFIFTKIPVLKTLVDSTPHSKRRINTDCPEFLTIRPSGREGEKC